MGSCTPRTSSTTISNGPPGPTSAAYAAIGSMVWVMGGAPGSGALRRSESQCAWGTVSSITDLPVNGTGPGPHPARAETRSEEHTYELQSLMRSSYAVFRLKKKKANNKQLHT